MAAIICLSILVFATSGFTLLMCAESRLKLIGIPLLLIAIFAFLTGIGAQETARHADYATMETIASGKLIKVTDCYGKESMTINGINPLDPGHDDFWDMWTYAGNGRDISETRLIEGNQYTIYKQSVFLGNNYIVVCK